MADNRIETFLKLCDLMNYRKTAEALNMTQPAVTQHIHHLEEEYGGKLFSYQNRLLQKTPRGEQLESYARALLYNEKQFKEQLDRPALRRVAVGATKTVGDYVIGGRICQLLHREDVSLELFIDNTQNLLNRLNRLELDLIITEGFVDKSRYSCRLLRREELVGICAKDHPFAGKEVSPSQLVFQHLILRESGSGTRAVLETALQEQGFTMQCFPRRSQISSFALIEQVVAKGLGVSFVYESIPAQNPELAVFRLQNQPIFHEFNYLFLPGTNPPLELFEQPGRQTE